MQRVIWTMLALVCGLLVASQAAGQELEAPDESFDITGSERDEILFRIEHEMLLKAYQESRRRPPPAWEEDLLAFFKLVAEWFAGVGSSHDELVEKGWALNQAGCRDRTFRIVLGELALRGRDSRGFALLNASIEPMLIHDGPPLLVARAALKMGEAHASARRPDQARAAFMTASSSFEDAIRAPGMTAEEQRWLYQYLSALPERLPAEHLDDLVKQLFLFPGPHPWGAHMLAGKWHIHKAWEARGTGVASTVTREGWRQFAQQLAIAREHLEKAHELLPQNPEAATEMIRVAMAGHSGPDRDQHFWFKQAAAAQIDWMPAYKAMLWALRPRWGGSHQEMIDFGLECAATGRFDTPVPGYLVVALRAVCRDRGDHDWVWRLPGMYDTVVRTLSAGIDAKPEWTGRVRHYRTTLAALAWRMGRYDDLAERMRELEGTWSYTALEQMRVHERDLLYDNALHTSRFAPLARTAGAAARAGDWRRAAELYAQALQECQPEEEALLSAVRDRLTCAQWQADFADGDWVDLHFVRGMPGWRGHLGFWSSQPDGSVQVEPTEDGFFVRPSASFGQRFEMEAEVDLTAALPEGRACGGIGFLYEHRNEQERWMTFVLDAAKKGGGLGYRWNRSRRVEVPDFRPRARLRLLVWDDAAVATIDGHEVHRGAYPPGPTAGWRMGDAVVLCGSYSRAGGTVTFRDVRIRKLSTAPAELSGGLTQQGGEQQPEAGAVEAGERLE